MTQMVNPIRMAGKRLSLSMSRHMMKPKRGGDHQRAEHLAGHPAHAVEGDGESAPVGEAAGKARRWRRGGTWQGHRR